MERTSGRGQRILFPLLGAALPLVSAAILAFALLTLWKQMLGLFAVPLLVLWVPLLLGNAAVLLAPHIRAAVRAKKGRPFYADESVAALFGAAKAAKLAVIPLFFATAAVLAFAGFFTGLIGFLLIRVFLLGLPLLLGSFPAAILLTVAALFTYASATSLYAISGLIGLMVDRRLRVKTGVLLILLLLLPFGDYVLCFFALPRVKKGLPPRPRSLVLMAVLPFAGVLAILGTAAFLLAACHP